MERKQESSMKNEKDSLKVSLQLFVWDTYHY